MRTSTEGIEGTYTSSLPTESELRLGGRDCLARVGWRSSRSRRGWDRSTTGSGRGVVFYKTRMADPGTRGGEISFVFKELIGFCGHGRAVMTTLVT